MIGLLCVSVGYADDITLITEDASSDTLLYGCGKYPRSGVYAVPYGDETRTLNLKIYQYRSSEDQTATITLGDTLIFGCSLIAPSVADTTVYDTIPDDGFDRIIRLVLITQEPPEEECVPATGSAEISIYKGDTLLFGCDTITVECTRDVTLRKADNSCDSIVTLTVSFLPEEECVPATGSAEISIYKGDTLLFGCDTITVECTRDVTLRKADNSCDSIVTLTVSFLSEEECVPATGSAEISIYKGDTLLFGCDTITVECTRDVTLRKADNSCDSIVTLTVSFLPEEECVPATGAAEISIYKGDTLLFGCDTITVECTRDVTLRKADNSCDSIVTLTVSFLPEYDSVRVCPYTIYDTICVGSQYNTRLQTLTLDADTAVNDTVFDAIVYVDEELHRKIHTDSLYIYYLSVWQRTDTTLQDSIELGQSYTFKGKKFTPEEPGIIPLYDTLQNIHKCDSFIVVELKVFEVIELRKTVDAAVDSTLCVGANFTIEAIDPELSRTFEVFNDTTVTDTLRDVRQLKDSILHTLTYIDSVTTYNLHVWASTDITLQDSIKLGESYVFSDEDLTPTESGLYTYNDTVPNIHGCDSITTLELTVIEEVFAEVYDTVCLSGVYTAGSQMLTITQDTIVRDTIIDARPFTDSITTYNILVWHNELDAEIEWGNAFCGTPYNGADEVLGALREAIEADDLFEKDTTLSLLWKDANGEYVPYTGAEMSPEAEEIDLRAEVSNACTTVQFDHTLSIQKPDYELSDEFADMPAVSKYSDWLLMIDLDSLNKVYGLYPEPDSVRWFHITGTDPDIDADELVGTGYYYTDDRHLVGSYYAIITLPEETDACGGSWRTRIVVRTSDSAPMLAPNAVRQGEPMWLYHLHASGEVHIFSANGVCARVLHYEADASDLNGIMRITTDALPAGVYMLHINNGVDRAAMPFIIRE